MRPFVPNIHLSKNQLFGLGCDNAKQKETMGKNKEEVFQRV